MQFEVRLAEPKSSPSDGPTVWPAQADVHLRVEPQVATGLYLEKRGDVGRKESWKPEVPAQVLGSLLVLWTKAHLLSLNCMSQIV